MLFIPNILTTRGNSSWGESSRISNGNNPANPAWPDKSIRSKGGSPSSKSASDDQSSNHCPWMTINRFSQCQGLICDDFFLRSLTFTLTAEYHFAFQIGSSRLFRLSMTTVELPSSLIRAPSQKYAFCRSSSVGML